MRMIIDGNDAELDEADLPILISGKEGSGASFFSIFAIANFLKRGNDIVFFSAYPMAKEDFRRVTSEEDRRRATIIDSGEEQAFLDAMEGLDEAKKPIVFVKNIENYSEGLFKRIVAAGRLMVSGDLDKCPFLDSNAVKNFATKIFFSEPEKYLINEFPPLEKYRGFIERPNRCGKIWLFD